MTLERLRIVTWNVWFGSLQQDERRRALWSQLEALDPDVVCLQEMLAEDLERPELRRWRDRGYWVSNEHIDYYDVVMLSRIPVTHDERLPLPTMMGRSLLMARLDVDPPLTVATIHLESTSSEVEARVQQLRLIDAHLAEEPFSVFLGDMNFDDDAPDETARVKHWDDAWLTLHPGEPGYTVDSHVNQMRFLSKGQHVQKRIDRVFSQGDGWRVDRIERLGMEAVGDDPLTFVSDHFGLCADLVRT